jgi:hypothetical protein
MSRILMTSFVFIVAVASTAYGQQQSAPNPSNPSGATTCSQHAAWCNRGCVNYLGKCQQACQWRIGECFASGIWMTRAGKQFPLKRE